ncbi:MAG: ribonuclease III [Bacteroidales bacterium]|nr:ribonuclease III [Bacteroidales bacterium]
MSVRNFLKYQFSTEQKLRKTIKNIFGFYPGNIFLYQQALRHKSASIIHKNGQRINNERLEYLGDSILNTVVSDYLYRRFPTKDEGFLTEMRSKIVSRSSLNKLAQKIGLDQFINTSASDMQMMKSAGGNAFEAFIGAIYLDNGYRKTRKILISHILRMHFDIEALVTTEISYKSKLIEWAQKEKRNLEFSLLNEENIHGHKQYTVAVIIDNETIDQATDYSIKGAETLAAEKTWNQFFTS